ncbi:MAG: hypothetical protein GEU98_13185 [Pseudonocardiaceae bacterium]|nr:hypothetical protein [Pseudonocardiaceae bacterium]
MSNPYGAPGSNPFPQPGYPQQPGGQPRGYGPPQGPPPGAPAQQGHAPPGMPQSPPPGPPPGAHGMPSGPMGGHPGPPPPPGMGRVVLHTKYFPLAFILALFKPGITINGQQGPIGQWGMNVIDLPPGQYHIQVHTNYIWKFGNAVAPIPLNPGQQIDAYYAAPAMPFGAGAIGPTPQEPPLKGVALGVFIGSFAFAILMIILAAVAI